MSSQAEKDSSEPCFDGLHVFRPREHACTTKTNLLSPGFQKQCCKIDPVGRDSYLFFRISISFAREITIVTAQSRFSFKL
jgi:hypothetical protein